MSTSTTHRSWLVSWEKSLCHTPRSWTITIRRSQPSGVNDLIIRTAEDIPLSNEFLILWRPRSAQNFYDLRIVHTRLLIRKRFACDGHQISGFSFRPPSSYHHRCSCLLRSSAPRVGLNTFSDDDHFAGFYKPQIVDFICPRWSLRVCGPRLRNSSAESRIRPEHVFRPAVMLEEGMSRVQQLGRFSIHIFSITSRC